MWGRSSTTHAPVQPTVLRGDSARHTPSTVPSRATQATSR